MDAPQPRTVSHTALKMRRSSRRETDRARALTMVSTNAPPGSIMPPYAHSSKRRGSSYGVVGSTRRQEEQRPLDVPSSARRAVSGSPARVAQTVREIRSAAIVAGEERQFLAARVASRRHRVRGMRPK
jgi:hypothetical protein